MNTVQHLKMWMGNMESFTGSDYENGLQKVARIIRICNVVNAKRVSVTDYLSAMEVALSGLVEDLQYSLDVRSKSKINKREVQLLAEVISYIRSDHEYRPITGKKTTYRARLDYLLDDYSE